MVLVQTCSKPILWVALALGLLSPASRAFAQAHVHDAGLHVVRASTVSAANLPAAMLEQHAIPALPNVAVLNVTVQRRSGDALRNVPAEVEVTARNLGGIETSVQMREMVADGHVSYLGVYRFLPREVLDFRISARPKGEEQAVTLEFRDRLGRR